MTPESDLAVIRRAYAKIVLHAAQVIDPRLEAALAATRREDFLGPAPWSLMLPDGGYPDNDVSDPVYLYQDLVRPILRDRGLNNGMPSFVVAMIHGCGLHEGDHVVHVGCGTGYYTALISQLLGASGRVLGLEIEPDLARRASDSLAFYGNAEVVAGDGWTRPLGMEDAILVNAGTPRIAETWLNALKPGGRLVVPLATPYQAQGRLMTQGIVFRIARDTEGYRAKAMSKVFIYPCVGSTDPEAEAALAAALANERAGKVTRLRRDEKVPDERCWLRGEGWSLTYD